MSLSKFLILSQKSSVPFYSLAGFLAHILGEEHKNTWVVTCETCVLLGIKSRDMAQGKECTEEL